LVYYVVPWQLASKWAQSPTVAAEEKEKKEKQISG